jgi:predicted NAD-dependent protein-ADP-ribosyltransferase YbiA (DUF1768 family)
MIKTLRKQAKEIYKVTDTHIYGFFEEHRYLSNFHQGRVLYEGIVYPSNEAAYQAQKTLDTTVRMGVFADPNCFPSKARTEGRKLVLRSDWLNELPEEEQVIEQRDFMLLPLITTVRDKIMLEINQKKFHSNVDLMEKLLATGDKYLEETNWWRDDYWGVWEGQGLNKLGRILMKIRHDYLQATV